LYPRMRSTVEKAANLIYMARCRAPVESPARETTCLAITPYVKHLSALCGLTATAMVVGCQLQVAVYP